MIEIDLSKQPALDADPQAIQKIIFTANLAQISCKYNNVFHY